MPAVRIKRQGTSTMLVGFVVFVGLLFAGLIVAAAYVAFGGSITVPFTNPPRVISLAPVETEKPWTPPEGKVGVLCAGRNIPAYSKVRLEDLVDAKGGRLSMIYVDPSMLKDGTEIITDLDRIKGRVLAHDKTKGYAFSEDDFLPEGTRAGLVAGIPAGKRAVRVELSKVRGLYGLNPGDRFDVVATIPVDGDPSKELRRYGGTYANQLALEASMGNMGRQATVRVIVQNGVVVTPVQTVEIPVSMSSLTRGNSVQSKPIQEVVVAVEPGEVAPFAEAMAVGAELAVVPRSGRPDDPLDSVTPELHPRTPFSDEDGEGVSMRFVETIGGTSRQIVPVPKQGAKTETEADADRDR